MIEKKQKKICEKTIIDWTCQSIYQLMNDLAGVQEVGDESEVAKDQSFNFLKKTAASLK